jgi:hypothetical protein
MQSKKALPLLSKEGKGLGMQGKQVFQISE